MLLAALTSSNREKLLRAGDRRSQWVVGDWAPPVSSRREYCTLFDASFLPRALALYRSLERCEEDFVLRAVCMDRGSRDLLTHLALPRLRIIDIAEVEAWDSELEAVRPTRSRREYCWTATAAVCRFILTQAPEVELLTYLDADLSFSSSPTPLFRELGGGSILIVPHRSPSEGTQITGIYNVGWVTFRNDEIGNAALAWWRERCLEWCYDRIEPERFGDQKYLDDWPERFPGVKICTNPGAGLAPWNEERHRLTTDGKGRVCVDGTPLIFHHYAGLRVYRGDSPSARLASWSPRYWVTYSPVRLVWSTRLRLPSSTALDLVWRPYVERLAEAMYELQAVGAAPTIGLRATPFRTALAQAAYKAVPRPVWSAYRKTPRRLQNRVSAVVGRR